MVSDEELRKWAEKYYPQYKDNLVLIRMLYEKLVMRGVPVSGAVEYEQKKVSEVKKGDRVEVKGVIVKHLRDYAYFGCPKCYRKNCDCGLEKVRMVRKAYLFGDDTGMLKIVTPVKPENEVSEYEFDGGEEVIVRGVVNEWDGEMELNARQIEVLSRPNIEEMSSEFDMGSIMGVKRRDEVKVLKVLASLKEVKEMQKEVFLRYIKRKYDLDWEDVKDYVKVEARGGEEWVIFE